MTDIDDKVEAGAKAVANKIRDIPADLKAEYRGEKAKEDVKDAAYGNLDSDAERAANKAEAGAKAVGNSIADAPDKLRAEYNKEKAKEALD